MNIYSKRREKLLKNFKDNALIILFSGNQPRIFSATFGNSSNELIVYSGFSVVPNPYDANTNGISASLAAS